jgi:hypothetical protein
MQCALSLDSDWHSLYTSYEFEGLTDVLFTATEVVAPSTARFYVVRTGDESTTGYHKDVETRRRKCVTIVGETPKGTLVATTRRETVCRVIAHEKGIYPSTDTSRTI